MKLLLFFSDDSEENSEEDEDDEEEEEEAEAGEEAKENAEADGAGPSVSGETEEDEKVKDNESIGKCKSFGSTKFLFMVPFFAKKTQIQNALDWSSKKARRVAYVFYIQSIFTDLLKDSNKDIDLYEGMFFHALSFDILLKTSVFSVSLT